MNDANQPRPDTKENALDHSRPQLSLTAMAQTMDSPGVPTTVEENSSWFIEGIGEVGQFALLLLKHFLRLFLTGAGFSLLLAVCVYFAVHDTGWWRAIAGSAMMLTVTLALTFVLGVDLAILLAVVGTIEAKRLGERILKSVFASGFGITDENPQGSFEITRSAHGMPIQELKARMHGAGRKMLEHPVTTRAVPRFARWLANKTQQILVWAMIRLIVAKATGTKTAHGTVDLLALRSSLSGYADEMLKDKITGAAYRVVWIAGLALVFASYLVIKVLRW